VNPLSSSFYAASRRGQIGARFHPGRIRLKRARKLGGWLLLAGWVVLPLLPVLGLGLTSLLGVGLF
jgi:ABC-type Fe3+ transport system permease subunit